MEMNTGATTKQIEDAAKRNYEAICLPRGMPDWQDPPNEYQNGYVDWAENGAKYLVPESHRIIALDDLKRLRGGFAKNVYSYGTAPEHQWLDRIDALIAGDQR